MFFFTLFYHSISSFYILTSHLKNKSQFIHLFSKSIFHITALLIYNSHTIQFIHLNCAAQLFKSIFTKLCHHHHKQFWNIFINLQRKLLAISSQFLFLPNSLALSSVQSLSHVWLFATPWIAARQASLSITISQSPLRLTSIESVMPSSHLILCHPLLLLPPIPPSLRVFFNESTLRIRWPKYWSFSFSIIPSKEHPGLISFRMDWLDLLAVRGTLKSLLQHHS